MSFGCSLPNDRYIPEIWTEAFPDPSVLTFPDRQLYSESERKWQLTEITDVTLRVGWSTVVLAERVEVGTSGNTSVANSQLVHKEVGVIVSLRVVSEFAGMVS